MHELYLLPHPDLLVMDLLNYSHTQVTLAMSWEVEMPPSSLHIPVNITTVLTKSLLEAFACLANILLAAPGQPTADGIAVVLQSTSEVSSTLKLP